MSWQRTLWRSEKKKCFALHKDGVSYKKIAKTLKLSCSTVAKTIQWFNRTGSTQNRPRHGRPKNLRARAQLHIQRCCVWEIDVWVLPALQCQPVSAQTIRHTLHQIGLHGCHPRRKPLLKMMHKKASKQFAEDKQTKDMDCWNNILWSDETKINLFGSGGVRHVWRSVEVRKYRWGVQIQVCLAYSQACWCECHEGLGLHECYRHWGATVHWENHECQHGLWHTEAEHDPILLETAGQYYNMIMTPNTPPRRPVPC